MPIQTLLAGKKYQLGITCIIYSGGLSPYILDEYRENIARQFPLNRLCCCKHGALGAFRKPDTVIKAIRRFLEKA